MAHMASITGFVDVVSHLAHLSRKAQITPAHAFFYFPRWLPSLGATAALTRPWLQVQEHDKVLQIMLEDEMRSVEVK